MQVQSSYRGIPVREPDDLGFIGPKPAYYLSYESACQNGPLSTVQSIVSEKTRTPVFLHNGLTLALSAGNVEVARFLLSAGAPIVLRTPEYIYSASSDKKLPLYELLAQHGWTPNTPGEYGELALPRIVTNHTVLRWFLAQGANPNLGRQRYIRGAAAGPDTDSCAALEAAAHEGDVEAVRMLLDAGALIKNGSPLHSAARACPPGANPHTTRVVPTKEFDTSMIPVMALLVERGADVNEAEKTRYVTQQFPINHAISAGAVERVRWLLEHGANPELRGPWGTAVQLAQYTKREEMIKVLEEGVAARKWIKDAPKTEPI
jgi:ankyrin repeat protein